MREEVSEKETQKSAVSASFAGVCTCVLASSLSGKGQWPDSLRFAYSIACLMGLNRNPVAVLLFLLHLKTSSGVAVPQLQEG